MNEDFWQYFAESFIKTETCIRVSTKRPKGEKRDFYSGKTFLNYSEHNFSLRGIFLWFFLERPKHWFISVADNQITNEKEFNDWDLESYGKMGGIQMKQSGGQCLYWKQPSGSDKGM